MRTPSQDRSPHSVNQAECSAFTENASPLCAHKCGLENLDNIHGCASLTFPKDIWGHLAEAVEQDLLRFLPECQDELRLKSRFYFIRGIQLTSLSYPVGCAGRRDLERGSAEAEVGFSRKGAVGWRWRDAAAALMAGTMGAELRRWLSSGCCCVIHSGIPLSAASGSISHNSPLLQLLQLELCFLFV